MSEKQKYAHKFFITLIPYDDADVEQLRNCAGAKYVYWCYEEAPTTGTKHIHAYIEMKRSIRFRTMINRWFRGEGERGAKVEICKGTQKQAMEYIAKMGHVEEAGTFVEERPGQRNDILDMHKAIREGANYDEIANTWTQQYYQYGRMVHFEMGRAQKDRSEKPQVWWVWGATGVGKTKWAVELSPESFYIKDAGTKWWDGYTQQEVIIIDDFRNWEKGDSDLLRLLDRYPYTAEVKGGHVKINSPTIVITSDRPPEKIWDSKGYLAQLRRRVEVMHMGDNMQPIDDDFAWG